MYIYIYSLVHFAENVWKSLIMWSDKYYSIYKLWLIFTPVVFVRHPDDLKVIKKHNLVAIFKLEIKKFFV